MFKSTTGLAADNFQAVFEFRSPVFIARILNFMMVKITKSLKVNLKMLNLEKGKTPSNQSVSDVLKLTEKWFYHKNACLAIWHSKVHSIKVFSYLD